MYEMWKKLNCVDRYLIESTTFNDDGHTLNIQGSINCKPVM